MLKKLKNEPLVRVQNLKRFFQKDNIQINVLNGINLTIGRGELIAIMGRSGAGKSTLLQIMGTLDRPSSGHVFFEEEDVFAYKESKLAKFRGRSIGFVFQFHHLLPEFTTLENAAMPAIIARMPKTEAFERAKHFLDRVELSDRLTHRPGELSGGEQQRVALARALVMHPKLLLADEPTGNLDSETGAQIFNIFRKLNEEEGVSVIVVTHNETLARSMSRTLMMKDGLLNEHNWAKDAL